MDLENIFLNSNCTDNVLFDTLKAFYDKLVSCPNIFDNSFNAIYINSKYSNYAQIMALIIDKFETEQFIRDFLIELFKKEKLVYKFLGTYFRYLNKPRFISKSYKLFPRNRDKSFVKFLIKNTGKEFTAVKLYYYKIDILKNTYNFITKYYLKCKTAINLNNNHAVDLAIRTNLIEYTVDDIIKFIKNGILSYNSYSTLNEPHILYFYKYADINDIFEFYNATDINKSHTNPNRYYSILMAMLTEYRLNEIMLYKPVSELDQQLINDVVSLAISKHLVKGEYDKLVLYDKLITEFKYNTLNFYCNFDKGLHKVDCKDATDYSVYEHLNKTEKFIPIDIFKKTDFEDILVKLLPILEKSKDFLKEIIAYIVINNKKIINSKLLYTLFKVAKLDNSKIYHKNYAQASKEYKVYGYDYKFICRYKYLPMAYIKSKFSKLSMFSLLYFLDKTTRKELENLTKFEKQYDVKLHLKSEKVNKIHNLAILDPDKSGKYLSCKLQIVNNNEHYLCQKCLHGVMKIIDPQFCYNKNNHFEWYDEPLLT